MTAPRRWTPAEERELANMYACLSLAEICAVLQRTPSAVKQRASYLRAFGVVVPTARPGHAPTWTPEQVEYLRLWWDLEPRDQTARYVGHSVDACNQRCYIEFGSASRERWDIWESSVEAAGGRFADSVEKIDNKHGEV